MYLRKDNAPKRKEIRFEEVFNGKVFETSEKPGVYYLKGTAKNANETDGIYAVNLETGVVIQPLMEQREEFNHLYICPGAVFEV